MDYIFTIDKFEGPLDLLLHLIKQSNISIYDIEIDKITKQYLNYINQMSSLNLDVASSYLVMAAELIEMKASILLPQPEIVEDDYEENPKDKLIKKLIAYQHYKDITSKLQMLELERKEYFTKASAEMIDYEVTPKLPEDVDVNDLIKIFETFLTRKQFEKPLTTKITSKEYSVDDRIKEVMSVINKKKKIKFSQLFKSESKSYIIVTFLSVLVLTKNHQIKIIQDNNFDEILLCEVK